MIPKTEAIVLKSFDYRETSRIVTFFTKEYGKITGLMKGIRKDPKKFGSSVDKYSVNDLVYYHYRNSDLHLVSHCDLKEYYFLVRKDYEKNVAANYGLELVDKIMQIEQINADVYQLMKNFLERLETEKDIDRLIYILQIKMLQLSGFSPHLDNCVKCNKKIEGKVRFSMISGGLVCHECPTAETSFTLISKGAVSTLLHIERNKWEDCLRIGLTRKVKAELKYILDNFLVYHLERKVKSSKYL
ncbi:MAG: DNA repair protein RecO [Candidatus Omnitrophica bacterium]|nr:DNA repair protein RecO [Candidatus Omnitrophota bacterium]